MVPLSNLQFFSTRGTLRQKLANKYVVKFRETPRLHMDRPGVGPYICTLVPLGNLLSSGPYWRGTVLHAVDQTPDGVTIRQPPGPWRLRGQGLIMLGFLFLTIVRLSFRQ